MCLQCCYFATDAVGCVLAVLLFVNWIKSIYDYLCSGKFLCKDVSKQQFVALMLFSKSLFLT